MFVKSSFLQDLVDVIYPKACFACREPLVRQEVAVCTNCLSELPRTDFHRHAENPVSQLFLGRCKLEKASSWLHFEKGGRVQRLMHAFKYRDHPEVGTRLGHFMGRELAAAGFFSDITGFLPIPLHPMKFKKRGYNQSAILARALADITTLAVPDDQLIRHQPSETQTRKSRFARWLNVESIFRLPDPARLAHGHWLLVDDVVTTGATVEACADLILGLPGTRVSLLTLAVARH